MTVSNKRELAIYGPKYFEIKLTDVLLCNV